MSTNKKTDQQLEQYLTRLDRALGQIAVSDRADIITEIRSHALDAQDREPSKSMNDILSSLGEPESVANRYLMERGLKAGKPAKTPMVKWLTIGFLGTFAIVTFAVVLILYKFTPLVKVDENKGTVQILGGLIDISDDEIRAEKVSATKDIDLKIIKKIKIRFSNGKMSLKQNTGSQLKWGCKATAQDAFPVLSNDAVTFNLINAKCEISYPRGLELDLEGVNGKLELNELTSNVNVDLKNGNVSFSPDAHTAYRYDLDVDQGRVDDFESSKSDKAVQIKIKLGNGRIAKDDD
jgi:hypothetical protein